MTQQQVRGLEDADYADIGRALVQHAIGQGKSKGLQPDDQQRVKTATIRVYLRFPDGATNAPDIWNYEPCCVCFLENGVVICKGPCCEEW